MASAPSKSLLTPRDRRRFIIAVQYELFLTDLHLSDLEEFDLLLRLAETASSRTLKRVLKELTEDETVQLIYYAFKHYREGSYTIFRTLKTIFAADHPLQKLIRGLSFYYYDVNQQMPIDLAKQLAFQEVFARKKTEVCFKLLCRLVHLIIESPLLIAKITGQDLQQAELRKQTLQRRFQYEPSLTEFEAFVRVFGLTNGLPFFWQGERQPETSLPDKLQLLCTLFERPEALADIPHAEMASFFSFVMNILLHIETLHQYPEKYAKGIQQLTCAMPTYNKHLDGLPALPSLLDGLQCVAKSLQQIPVFIYDQSDPKIYAANQRYSKKLEQQYNCNLLHLSLSQILTFAERLGIEKLLDTTQQRRLGYGGARNSVFLLTPVLKQLFENGYRTITAMLSVDTEILKKLFRTHVIGDAHQPGSTLLMIDDDMEIPPSNLFCHALFSYESSDRYTASAGYAIGRATKFQIAYISLKEALNNPKSLFASTEWSQQICSAAMSEYVTKPTLCLNLPFGSEERHVRGVLESNPLLHPSIHLASARYPTQNLPTQPWVGIEEYLVWYLPYSINLAMVLSLLDPRNLQGRCVFPWNQNSFTHLGELIHSIASPEQQKEMQHRFWKNFQLFRQSCPDMTFVTAIKDLIDTDVKSLLLAFQKTNHLTASEKSALHRIGQIYLSYQFDASLLWHLSTLVGEAVSLHEAKDLIEKQHNIRLDTLPLTHGFYLLLHSVGNGEFPQILRQLDDFHD